MSKKKILSLALVVCMIAILSFSSLAWFTDVDKATNDFTIGGAGTDDPDDIFSVDVKENVDGEDEPVDEMDFEDVLPGDLHKKEAFIENTGSYDQYIRVVMTITDWKLIKDVTEIKMDAKFNDNWHILIGIWIKNKKIVKTRALTRALAFCAIFTYRFMKPKGN